jgi:uncharacterized membrane protein
MFWVILLRIVHVFAAALWFGGAIFSTFFIGPAVKATSPDSGKFMQYFLRKRHFHAAMTWFANLTILAGTLLFWRDSFGFSSSWLAAPTGIGFSIGACFGILVYLWGFFVVSPTSNQMGKIGEALQSSGGQPTSQLIRDMQAIERKFTIAIRVDTALIMLALLFMATARYFGMLF